MNGMVPHDIKEPPPLHIVHTYHSFVVKCGDEVQKDVRGPFHKGVIHGCW